MQTLRLFEILYILLQNKKTTAKYLAQHFEVSVRTIYRDLDVLTLAGIPIYTNKGKNGGIFLNEDYILNRSFFSDDEQAKLLAALRSQQIVDPEASDTLLSKLSAIFQKPEIPWIQVDFRNWQEEDHDDLFLSLKSAILQHQVVTFLYHDAKGNSKQRTVEPLQLLFKGQAWYLVAYCRERKAQRTFKIKRMQHLEILPQHFTRDLIEVNHPYQQYQQTCIDVVLRIDLSMGYRVFEEFPRDSIEVKEDHYLIKCRMPDCEMTYGILISYGEALTVQSPAHIKEGVILRIQKILNNYL